MLQQTTGMFVRFTWVGSEMIRIAPANMFTGSAWVSSYSRAWVLCIKSTDATSKPRIDLGTFRIKQLSDLLKLGMHVTRYTLFEHNGNRLNRSCCIHGTSHWHIGLG